MFFWLVLLPKGRYKCQAPYADVSEILGLRGGAKTAKNGQKRPKMTIRGRTSIKPIKLLNKLGFWANLTVRGWN